MYLFNVFELRNCIVIHEKWDSFGRKKYFVSCSTSYNLIYCIYNYNKKNIRYKCCNAQINIDFFLTRKKKKILDSFVLKNIIVQFCEKGFRKIKHSRLCYVCELMITGSMHTDTRKMKNISGILWQVKQAIGRTISARMRGSST